MTTKSPQKKHSKRYQELANKIDKNKLYSLSEVIALVKQTSAVKFDAGVEMHAHLGIDHKKGDQQVRGTVSLPHGTGKKIKIAAFVPPEQEKAVTAAGADLVGGVSLIAKIKETSKSDFDVAVATPAMMKELAKIAKILGPRNLMPSPKNETVTADVAKAVTALKKGRLAFKNDDTGNLHLLIGRVSFSDQQLLDNLTTFIETLKTAKPTAVKGVFIKSLTLTSSMGPAVKLQP